MAHPPLLLPACVVLPGHPVRRHEGDPAPVRGQAHVEHPRVLGPDERPVGALRVLGQAVDGRAAHARRARLAEQGHHVAGGPDHLPHGRVPGEGQVRQGQGNPRRVEIGLREVVEEEVPAALVEEDVLPVRGDPEGIEVVVEFEGNLAHDRADREESRVQGAGEELIGVDPVDDDALDVVEAAVIAPADIGYGAVAHPAQGLREHALLLHLRQGEVVEPRGLGVHDEPGVGGPDGGQLAQGQLHLLGDDGLRAGGHVQEGEVPVGGGARLHVEEVLPVRGGLHGSDGPGLDLPAPHE
jgi:hypothetical protein